MNLGMRHALLSLVALLAVRAAAAQAPPLAPAYSPSAYPAVVASGEAPAQLPPTGEAPPTPNPQGEDQKKENGEKKKDGQEKKEEDKEGEKPAKPEDFSLHGQMTTVAQGDPPFRALYSGPNSLSPLGERQETLAADLMVGLRLWCGAEIHADAMMWQGFGLSDSFGIEDFPSGDAFKAGTQIPDFMFSRLFIRQTFGFGGEQEDVPGDTLNLAGKRDISRLTITVGRFTPTDQFDNNAYAKDPHTQFLNWALCSNLTWDFPSDSVGYTTGIAAELNQPDWALRYGFFQMPGEMNGFTADDRVFCWPSQGSGGDFWRSWGMMTELERRWKLNDHPGAIRSMLWLDSARMFSFAEVTPYLVANPPPPHAPGAGVTVPPQFFNYRYKWGFGMNLEQEITEKRRRVSRYGCNDGHEGAWTYTDANWAASTGVAIKGAALASPRRHARHCRHSRRRFPRPNPIPTGGRHGHPQRRRELDLRL